MLVTLALAACTSSKGISKDSKNEKPKRSAKENAKLRQLFIEASAQETLNNYEEALELYRQCVKLDPSNDAVFFAMSESFEELGNVQESLKYGLKARNLDATNPWYHLQLAELYYEQGKFGDAAESYQKLVEILPDHEEYLIAYADALMLNEEIEKAIGVFDKLEKRLGPSEQLARQKYHMYMTIDEPEKAIAEIQKLVDLQPNRVENLLLLAEAYEQNQKTDQLKEIYEKILELDPDNGYALLYMAALEDNQGNEEAAANYIRDAFRSPELSIDSKIRILLDYYDYTNYTDDYKQEALDLLDILIDVHPNEAKAYSIYGDFLNRDNENKKAREMFLKALELDDSKYVIWNEVLILDAKMRDYGSLFIHSEEAINIFPNQPGLYYFKGLAGQQIGEYQEAIDYLLIGKDLVLNDDQLLFNFYQTLGDAYYGKKQWDRAFKAFDKALKIKPNESYVLNNYAYYLSLKGEQLDKAEEMSKRANELLPGNAAYQDTYGWILFQQGKYDEAKKWIEKAIENGGSSVAIFEHYGDALFKTGKKEEAQKYWKMAEEAGAVSEILKRKIKDGEYYEE